jgi:type IV fimbrial biogenesis protein FimT
MECNRKHRGVTLIETAATSAVLAIVAGAAAPMYQDVLARRLMDGTATQLAIDIQYARSEAVARNQGLRISFQSNAAGSCYVIHTGSSGECSCANHPVAQCSGTAKEIKTVQLPASAQVQLASNVNSMLFHPVRGTVSPAGSLRLTGPKGIEVRHVVNIIGRTRSCSPQGSMTGYRAC